MLPVFTMWMRTGVTGPRAGTSPFSIAHGPTPGEDVAAVLAVADLGRVHDDLQEQVVDVGVRPGRRAR